MKTFITLLFGTVSIYMPFLAAEPTKKTIEKVACSCEDPKQGPQGPAGPQGEQGDQGDPGPQGPSLPLEGFSAKLSASLEISENTFITGWTTETPGGYNSNGNFDEAQGLYTVPEAGTYNFKIVFTISHLSGDSDTGSGPTFRVVDTILATVYDQSFIFQTVVGSPPFEANRPFALSQIYYERNVVLPQGAVIGIEIFDVTSNLLRLAPISSFSMRRIN